jgi:hypothetical protein
MSSTIRRGRKPKASIDIDEAKREPPTPNEDGKSKRGRKPKVFLASNAEPGRSMSDDENVVLNLKVFEQHSCSISTGKVLMPDPYNDVYNDSFLSKPLELQNNHMDEIISNHTCLEDCHNLDDIGSQHKPSDVQTSESNTNSNTYRVIELLKDFEEKNKQNEWPTTTSIYCYWCSHRFNNVPFGIPVKYCEAKFHVYGCFCSLECCAAYNMTHYDSVDDMWERYMLINMLSRYLNYKSIVKPAPSRLSLKAFGGHMTIEEFRQYCCTGKLINVNFPPMMTLTQQIEEINESDMSNDLKYIPIDTDRINKYKEKMKLKRAKPITNYKNTLDHAMNLKIMS